MRGYRSTWAALVVLLGSGSFVLAGAVVGWPVTIATPLGSAALGAMIAFSFVEDAGARGRAMTRWALWFGVATILVIGLPLVLQAWSALVLVLLAGGAPDLVEFLGRTYRRSRPGLAAQHPEQLSTDELARRWRQTSAELLDRGTSTAHSLELVEERARMLDEIERRDPQSFERWLVHSGWRESDRR